MPVIEFIGGGELGKAEASKIISKTKANLFDSPMFSK
jgi:hypothetical protein